ncbi:DNA repair protein RadA [Dissulfurirhabdus thermomarina]|uniref:DNA repair protein RadA n=1 Tax=Dissulfurirhabdus thermomarina TaxID=1765737 RepID=A0A6N9TN53_DISTH|nr:DNA repair protein RadA [Dissulfurirhabdus thermomarina]NDY42478.1 DNA repair protein RadA [Dissulfurirhabdus thermomarina]NMX23371.1 DNA repair protein RadA [Dissulfurirhabdus thermomarina]
MRTVYVCQSCGHTSPKWLGRCPGCEAWHSFAEERAERPGRGRSAGPGPRAAPRPLAEVAASREGRLATGMAEMDRVLGGGLVDGALVLLGGEPGIGKSTLLLQVLRNLAGAGRTVLYVSGEESAAQIRLRAERLGEIPPGLWVVAETDLAAVEAAVREMGPAVLAVDSIQTVAVPELGAAPGSVSQVREGAARLLQLGKGLGLPVFIVGHVTKDGAIAGPRVLEHLVDTVLYFEGDRSHAFRLLRTVKNRYGPTHEVGVFEMGPEGLREVPNPSSAFMGRRSAAAPGTVVIPCLEGSRPILVEVQALVTPSYLAMPRRTATGVDGNRLALLLAVMEKRLGFRFHDRDVFVNVAGGLRITEPGADLGVAAALISSYRDRPLPRGLTVLGEVGLTGEIRPVARAGLRLAEAARLGFRRCLMPPRAGAEADLPAGMEVVAVDRLEAALDLLLEDPRRSAVS